ncbi:HD domain-containing protein, partial [Candidatus Saccharibacteria bacterium]|nr:HD domain-containing protein [Candidatus Saccharibacteria bacterium]
MGLGVFNKLTREKFPQAADQKKIAAGLEYATKKHAGQKRLSGDPYIKHPVAVATLLAEWDMDVDSVVAGLLHDTVEDTDTEPSEIKEQFGEHVAMLVNGVTKVSHARAGRKDVTNYLPGTNENLSKLLIATGSDVRVIIIKLADRLHNLRTLEYQSPENQLKKAHESLEVFGPLADRLNMGLVRTEIEDISFSYLAPKRYNKLKNEMNRRLGAGKKKLNKVRAEVVAKLREEKLDFEMDGRLKSIHSLHKK